MRIEALPAGAREFVERVLATHPAIGVFDCDGTLWSGDSGADFFYWEIERGLIPKAVADAALARYDLYNRGQVDETTMCGEMVQIHAGLSERVIREAAEKFFSEVGAQAFSRDAPADTGTGECRM